MTVCWNIYEDQTKWASGIAACLVDAVSDGGTLIITGGSSPAPIYQQMAEAALPWGQITLLLSDDRMVPATHDQSNLGLAKSHFGTTGATIPALTEDAARAAMPAKAGLLGMGPDGHILSWFAGADGYDTALTTDRMVCTIDAKNSPIAQPITDRITLTHATVALCPQWHIAIKGDDKRAIAMAAQTDPDLYPVGALLRMDALTTTIHWCP